MNAGDDTSEWLSQARRGVLELCVLTVIAQRPQYGYALVTRLSRWEQLAATEGTLYPLLRRMQKDGLMVATWQESGAGPPRKYYQLTPAGEERLRYMTQEWSAFTRAIQELQDSDDDEEDDRDRPASGTAVSDGTGSAVAPAP